MCNHCEEFSGLPCPHCAISLKQRMTIRNNIYGLGWRKKRARLALGAVRPMAQLIALKGDTVVNNGSAVEKAVLKKDLKEVLRYPVLHLKPGTTKRRIYANMDDLVHQAAEHAGIRAKVSGVGGSVVNGVGFGSSVNDAGEVRKQMRTGEMPAEYYAEAEELLRPAVWIEVLHEYTAPGPRKMGREAGLAAVQVLAPSLQGSLSMLPGHTYIVPWVLYQVEVEQVLDTGSEFKFAAKKYHFPDPAAAGQSPATAHGRVVEKREVVGEHGVCDICTDISQNQRLRSFEEKFAALAVDPGETHGHAIDRKLGELRLRMGV